MSNSVDNTDLKVVKATNQKGGVKDYNYNKFKCCPNRVGKKSIDYRFRSSG